MALNQPLVDAHLIRQCFTAAATKDLIDEPDFHLSSKALWVGDLDIRYIQELPLYNYLVVGVHKLIGHLDLSGKVTTILLWAASFFCLQFIWERILNSQQTFWANLLFVIAPLSVFFGQAFMPEMLVQALAFAFVLLVLRYDENPSLLRWSLCAGIGLAALLVKLPETAHLYLILGFLVFRREGRAALVRPRYLIAAVLTIAALKLWGNHIDAVNIGPLSMDSSTGKLSGYIGTLDSRFHFLPWAMVGLYLVVFILPGTLASRFFWILRTPGENSRSLATVVAPLLSSLVRHRTELSKLLQPAGARAAVRPLWNRDDVNPRMAETNPMASQRSDCSHPAGWAAGHPGFAISLQTRSPDSGGCPVDEREHPTRRCHSFPTDSPVGHDRASLQSSAGILIRNAQPSCGLR